MNSIPKNSYTTKIIQDPKQWEDFLKTQKYQIFVQSPSYGHFNEQLGDNSFILGIFDQNQKLIGGSLIITIHARRGNFYYLPYGPILNYETPEHLNQFTKDLKKIAKQNKIKFIRISPFVDNNPQHNKTVKQCKYIKSPMHMIAETTWILPLDQPTEDLMKQMRQNHRNLIRRSQRDGVEVQTSNDINDIELLHNLLQETAQRHKFHPYPLKYLQEEFQAFNKHGQANIYIAKHEGDLLAVSVVYFYENTAVYRHGASNMLKPKIPASYAIQWQAIQDAKTKGCKYYNFWGIAPEEAKKHPFKGITRFKKGFGGFQEDLLHARDYPVSIMYIKNWLIETVRRIKRGF